MSDYQEFDIYVSGGCIEWITKEMENSSNHSTKDSKYAIAHTYSHCVSSVYDYKRKITQMPHCLYITD